MALKIIEGSDRLVAEEKVDPSPLSGVLMVAFVLLLTAGILSSDAPTALAGGPLVLAPFLVAGLYLSCRPYKQRHVFDVAKAEYVAERVGLFGVKRAKGDLRQATPVQVDTWESSEDYIHELFAVRVVFQGDAYSLHPPWQARVLSEYTNPAEPLRLARAISAMLQLPEPQIVKAGPTEIFFKEEDGALDRLAKQFDRRFR